MTWASKENLFDEPASLLEKIRDAGVISLGHEPFWFSARAWRIGTRGFRLDNYLLADDECIIARS
jgi:hypothetical protein